jgi:hypothetical protein
MDAVCSRGTLLYEADAPIKHRCYSAAGSLFAVLGSANAPFGGTDTLSYTAVSSSARWLASLSVCAAGGLVFAEGDRLANSRFFEEARALYRVVPVYLNCPDQIAHARRGARAAAHALKPQAPTWVRGRATKHRNLAEKEPGTVMMDATHSPLALAAEVWALATGEV